MQVVYICGCILELSVLRGIGLIHSCTNSAVQLKVIAFIKACSVYSFPSVCLLMQQKGTINADCFCVILN